MLVDREGMLHPLHSTHATRPGKRGRPGSGQRMRWIGAFSDRANLKTQETGYLVVAKRDGQAQAQAEAGGSIPTPRQVIVTPVLDPESGEFLGGFLLGAKAQGADPQRVQRKGERRVLSGLFVEDAYFEESGSLTAETRAALAARLANAISSAPDPEHGDFEFEVGGVPHLVHFHALNPGSMLPVAYHVNASPLTELHMALTLLKLKAGAIGLGILALGALAAFLVSRGLTKPLKALSAATHQIAEGDLSVRVEDRSRDELGQLARSFNGMAGDLALKERYRSVLDKVADRDVAQALVDGDLALGGELRHASILFCDIRGFTALTEQMPPEQVIGLLNEHMTALTEIVYAHSGVVDKFVGDLIMAIFGVPKSSEGDTVNAARCALEMVARRAELNRTGQRVEIGIGLATGEIVAGCMGSENRLNYTVLGERVNLASRLCDVAGTGEVIIDSETRESLGPAAEASPRGPFDLKGFSGSVDAFALTGLDRLDEANGLES